MCLHEKVKTSCCLNVSRLSIGIGQKLIVIRKRRLHFVAETVFPNLVFARVVPEGPQTRGKVHGKCKWIAEAVFG